MAEIITINEEADNVKTFLVEKSNGFQYQPGQFVWISLPNIGKSPMAIASGLMEEQLLFSVRKWGKLTEALFEMKSGDSIYLSKAQGSHFPVDILHPGSNLYLVGGGTGITPLRSLIKSLKSDISTMLIYGAKAPSELLFQNEITSWPVKLNQTIDTASEGWSGNIGFVTDTLRELEIKQGSIAFVCGPTPMLKAVSEVFREKGFQDKNIFVSIERFDNKGNVIGPVLRLTDPIVGI